MDENVHVASTLRLADALIKTNKDFDMVIMPNRPHDTDDPDSCAQTLGRFRATSAGSRTAAGLPGGFLTDCIRTAK